MGVDKIKVNHRNSTKKIIQSVTMKKDIVQFHDAMTPRSCLVVAPTRHEVRTKYRTRGG